MKSAFRALLEAGDSLSTLVGNMTKGIGCTNEKIREATDRWNRALEDIKASVPYLVVEVWGVKPHVNAHKFEAVFLTQDEAKQFAMLGPKSPKGELIRAWHLPIKAVRVTAPDGDFVYFPLREHVEPPIEFRVSSTVEEAEKQVALSKLSDRERKLLGLR